MLHFMLICENDKRLQSLQALFPKEGILKTNTYIAQLNVTSLTSFDEGLEEIAIIHKRLVSLVFKPLYKNTQSLIQNHLDIAETFLPEGFSVKVKSTDPNYVLEYNDEAYEPIGYISEFGDWLYPFKHIATADGIKQIHQQLIYTGIKIMAGISNNPSEVNSFMSLLDYVASFYSHKLSPLDQAVINGKLGSLLSTLNNATREFMTTLIGLHYHCHSQLRFQDVPKLKELIDWIGCEFDKFGKLCVQIKELNQPFEER